MPTFYPARQVAGYLEQILLHEFDLFIEDGSLDEVGALLCQYYALCARSSEQEILAQLRSLPRCDLSLCKCEDQDDQNLHRNLNSIEENVENMEVSEPPAPVVDEDGFTLVQKKKR